MDESRFVPAPVSSEPPDVSDLRCSDCHQLRRSLPRHTSGCRYAGQNCPGCAYAAEEHIASCPIASQLKLPTDDCCEGVDLPSIGHAHSPDCANPRRVVRASYTLPSSADLDHVAEELDAAEATKAVGAWPPEVNLAIADKLIDSAMRPAPDPGGRRDALLGELVFAARALAQSRIAELPWGATTAVVVRCCECYEHVCGGPHARHCLTGRVLKVLDELLADAEANLRPRVTVVIGGEGDARPQSVPGKPGFIARECPKCGRLDGAWQAQQMPGAEVQLDLLGMNQCVGAGIGGKGHTLYTHQCAMRPNGGAR